jgi:hypothetical protein
VRRIFTLAVMAMLASASGCGGSEGRSSSRREANSPTTVNFIGDTTTTRSRGGSSARTGTDRTQNGSPKTTARPVDRHGAPAVGRYVYDTTLTTNARTETGYSSYDVADNRPVSDGFETFETWGEKGAFDRVLARWRRSGRTVEIEQLKVGRSVSPSCDWTPDYLDMKLPLAPGTKWSATTACDEGHDLSRERSFSAEVAGTERVDVGGVPVDTVVIRRVVSSTTHAGAHLLRTDESYTDKFAPSVNLLVQTTGTETKLFDGVPQQVTTRSRKLQSLRAA